MSYTSKNTNVSPYYDDFDATKGFLRVLFQPGRAVQGRELTQLQTILQNQIGEFGNHIFKNYTVIAGGEVGQATNNFFRTTPVLGFDPTSYIGASIYKDVDGSLVTGTAGADYKRAQVTHVVPATDDDEYDIFFIKELSGNTFAPGDSFRALGHSAAEANSQTISIPSSISTHHDGIAGAGLTGQGKVATVQEGLFYVDKYFVTNNKQQFSPYTEQGTTGSDGIYRVLRQYTSDISQSVGFDIGHEVVDYLQDSSLLDPSSGTTNFTAPGADRYKMTLTMGQQAYAAYAKDGTDADGNAIPDDQEIGSDLLSTDNYFELIRFYNGNVQNILLYTQYSGLEQLLARRTYEESGNYIVSGLEPTIMEHLRDSGGTQGATTGYYTAAQGGSASKYVVDISDGKAYIEGYEFQSFGDMIVAGDKARTFKSTSGENVTTNLGAHVKVTNTAGGITMSASLTDFTDSEPVHLVGRNNPDFDGGGTGAIIGKARLRTLQSDGTDTKVFLGDIEMGSTAGRNYPFYLVDTIHGISGSTLDGSVTQYQTGAKLFTVDASLGKVAGGGLTAGMTGTNLFGAPYTTNIFPVNNYAVKSVSGLDYNARYMFSGTIASNSLTIQSSTVSSNSNVKFPTVTTDAVPGVGSIQVYNVDEKQFLTNIVSGSPSDGQVKISHPTGFGSEALQLDFHSGDDTDDVLVFVNMIVDDSGDTVEVYRTKTKTEGITASITMSLNSAGRPEGTIPYTDIYKINSISLGGTGSDVKESFQIDNGQRDTIYDFATITGLPSSSVASGESYVVNFDYWKHDTGVGPFISKSYGVADYENIPSMISQVWGIVSLRDVLDFRPSRDQGNTAADAGFSPTFIPSYGATNDVNPIQVDYAHYLGRIDRLYLRNDKKLILLEGEPSELRTPPTVPTDGMLIATLSVPPYTFSTDDIDMSVEDNSRYTMRDIGSLVQRIERNEYYTALNQLESNAENTTMLDANGLPRFKNGILVDPFDTFNIAAHTHPDFNAFIENNECTCPKAGDQITLEQSETEVISDSLIKTDDDIYMLKPTRKTLINQTTRSGKISVNPYNVVSFTGDIKLFPSTDTWTATRRQPTRRLRQRIDARVQGQIPGMGRVLAGTNTPVGGVLQDLRDAGPEDATFTRNRWGWNSGFINPLTGGWDQNNAVGRTRVARGQIIAANRDMLGNNLRLTNRRTSGRTIDTFAQIRTQRIRQTSSTTNSSVNLGQRVVRTENVAMMRARTISVAVTGLKPNTVVYPFFDRQQVAEFCRPATWGSSQASITPLTGSSLGDELKTNDNGRIAFRFELPAGEFRTGSRMLKVTDEPSNSAQLESTFAEAEYTATGILQVVQNTTLTTSVRRTRITRSPAQWSEAGAPVARRWVDPVAESIMISADEYPNGLFAHSVDLFFAAKDENLPVSVEIRPTVNGYPSSGEHIPMSKVVLNPDEVTALSDWSGGVTVRTRFEFSTPVYLTPGEYSIVVISNSDKYEVWYSTMGEFRLNSNGTPSTTRITAQPYTGSFFKSQNASTWTADQNSDLCFRLNICEFDNTSGDLYLKQKLDTHSVVQEDHPYAITGGSEGSDGNQYYYQQYHQLIPSFTIMEPGDTSIFQTTRTKTYAQIESGEAAYSTFSGVQVGQPIYPEKRQAVLLSDNHPNLITGSNDSLKHHIKFTGSQYLSPQVDGERMCLETEENLINNNKNSTVTYNADGTIDFDANPTYNGDLEPLRIGANPAGANYSSLVRYITRNVVLEEGISALGLSVFLTELKPPGTELKVFARFVPEGSEENILKKKWIQLTRQTEFESFTDFREIEYKLTTEAAFGQFQVKVVMYADPGFPQAPILKDLRAIAVT